MRPFARQAIAVLIATGCNINPNQDPRTGGADAAAQNGPALRLSWDAASGTVTEYHVFGLQAQKSSGGTECSSLTVTDANKAAPSIDIDLAKTTLPTTGQVCFYVTAENNGAMSPPSTAICTML